MRNPFRRQVEERAVTSVPWESGGVLRPAAVTQERALALTPVYAANRFLADTISTLPLKSYRQVGDTRQPMSSMPQLFQFLTEDGTLIDWLCKSVTSLALQGNAIGVITSRDGFGFPTGVEWRPRHEFSVNDDVPGRPVWYWMGRRIDRSEILHIPWLTIPGRTLGLSPIEAFALTVAGGIAAQTYGNEWFDNGGVPPGTFQNQAQEVPQQVADEITDRLVAKIRSRRPLVYGRDWKYDAISVPPEEAQFVETLNLTANQIAAIYGIAPEEIGGVPANSLTYNTEELRMTRRLADVRPWLERLEAGFSSVLPERQYVKLNAAAVIRGDLMTRYRAYQIARQIGLLNIDEIRAYEDLAPLPNGLGKDPSPLAWTDQPGELQAFVAQQALEATGQSVPSPNGQQRALELAWARP
jgi:HK97 family phage portal protein